MSAVNATQLVIGQMYRLQNKENPIVSGNPKRYLGKSNSDIPLFQVGQSQIPYPPAQWNYFLVPIPNANLVGGKRKYRKTRKARKSSRKTRRH